MCCDETISTGLNVVRYMLRSLLDRLNFDNLHEWNVCASYPCARGPVGFMHKCLGARLCAALSVPHASGASSTC